MRGSDEDGTGGVIATTVAGKASRWHEASRWRPLVATVLSLFGLGAATYLTYVHYTGSAQIERSCGGLGSAVDCLKVITSAESMILGVPVALWGALFFVFMVGINLPRVWTHPSIWVARARLAASICSMGFVIYLISAEAFEIHKICLWCTGVHVTAFLLFLVIASGWQDTGWARLVASYDAELAGRGGNGDAWSGGAADGSAGDIETEDAGVGASLSAQRAAGTNAYSRRVPRAPRSERKHAGAGR